MTYIPSTSTTTLKRVTSSFTKTTDTTLADITGLSVSLAASTSYVFEAVLHVNANVSAGAKFALSGTVGVTDLIYELVYISNDTSANALTVQGTTLNSASGQTGATSGFCRITGCITTSTAGTLTAQFAQNVSNLSSTVFRGSYLRVDPIA